MKKIIIVACLILSTVAVKAKSEGKGMKFFHGTYEELLAEAKKQDKKIFIDFYTKWCGPCRAMAKNVFPLENVGKFYNKHFINYKVDAEVGEGPMLAKKYKVQGYPTFTYTDADGKSIYEGSSIGASDEAGFLRLGRLALGLEKKDWAWYQNEFKKGNRKTAFLEEYFNARMAAEHKSPSEEDIFMLYESYPESERWTGKPLNMAFWNAKYGSKFYPIVVANKDKFPMLKDGQSMASWLIKDLYYLFDDKEKLAETFNAMKADFPTFAEQAMELFQADRLRFEDKLAEQVAAMMKYVEKYGEPRSFGFKVGSSALQSKDLKAEHADYIRKIYKEGLEASPIHFHSVGGYLYLTYKAGKVNEAKKTAKKFEKEAEKYKNSKKLSWAYDVVQKLLKGEDLVPFSYSYSKK